MALNSWEGIQKRPLFFLEENNSGPFIFKTEITSGLIFLVGNSICLLFPRRK